MSLLPSKDTHINRNRNLTHPPPQAGTMSQGKLLYLYAVIPACVALITGFACGLIALKTHTFNVPLGSIFGGALVLSGVLAGMGRYLQTRPKKA